MNLVDPLGLQQCNPAQTPCGNIDVAPGPHFGNPGTIVGPSRGANFGPSCTNCMGTPPPQPTYPAALAGLDPTFGTLQELLDWLFGSDEITVTGRAVHIEDLGTTTGGTITIIGRIRRDPINNALEIDITYLKAEGYGRTGIIVQGLDKAVETARRLGLDEVRITATLGNDKT